MKQFMNYFSFVFLISFLFTYIAACRAEDPIVSFAVPDFVKAELRHKEVKATVFLDTLEEELEQGSFNGPNWGLKNNACKFAGYPSLSSLTGDKVLLYHFSTKHKINSIPVDAWVVTHQDQVACIYLAARADQSVAPGIYSVTQTKK